MQAFAERRQTARLLASTVTKLTKMVTSHKRGDLRGAGKALGVNVRPRRVRKYKSVFSNNPSEAFASGVLELQYGWRPLYSDIYGSAELVAQKIVRESIGRATSKVTERRREVTVIQGGGGHADMYFAISRKVTSKYVIYYATSSDVDHTLSQVGITNPALIAWELTPWSFVFDWLVPIGNYISSFDAVAGLRFVKGTKTAFEYITQFGKGVTGNTSGAGIKRHYSYTGSSDCEVINLTRTALHGFPDIDIPTFKNPFSNKKGPESLLAGGAEHAINLLALLRSNLRLR
jgi:hypothetical protein